VIFEIIRIHWGCLKADRKFRKGAKQILEDGKKKGAA